MKVIFFTLLVLALGTVVDKDGDESLSDITKKEKRAILKLDNTSQNEETKIRTAACQAEVDAGTALWRGKNDCTHCTKTSFTHDTKCVSYQGCVCITCESGWGLDDNKHCAKKKKPTGPPPCGNGSEKEVMWKGECKKVTEINKPASSGTGITGKQGDESSVGQTSSSGAWKVEDLKVPCAFDGATFHQDTLGMGICNQKIQEGVMKRSNTWPNPWWMTQNPYRCYANGNRVAPSAVIVNANLQEGTCDCEFPSAMATDGSCLEYTCNAKDQGSFCRTCVTPLTTRNDECASCNPGFVLVDGNCLQMDCTEDPDDWEWHGCQECRAKGSRRHTQDCLKCAHGYHFLEEQRNLPNSTASDPQYSSGTLVVKGQETGYCFPYECVAGGNLLSAFPNMNMNGGKSGSPIFYPQQRTVMITPIVSTAADSRDPSVPELNAEILAFRDHCRTCVPQQIRLKDNHCETCNPGYYLDEMHHTCRKKTCGVPHFRRNPVSCTDENLVPKPNSTPCTDCEDNSVEECCVYVPPVKTCGAQNVFCAPGTQRENYQTIECGITDTGDEDDCNHYSLKCCEPLTCGNQQVACRKDQTEVEDSDTECTDCKQGGSECCVDKPLTCGIMNVKCGPTEDGILQHNLPADTKCKTCANDGSECCKPRQKTCQNQGVFCHAGTHRSRAGEELPVVCTDCENYGEECCEATTCLNQRVMCAPGRVHKGEEECVDCINNTDECCKPLPPVQDTCGNQLVKCEPRLFKPAATHCETKDKTCDDYGKTCCFDKTCGNQEVGCNALQAVRPGSTACVNCADGGAECCAADRTCGLMGVKCELGGYRHPDTKCDECDNNGKECCVVVPKTCDNQGVICLPGTRREMGTGCKDCQHYGDECCVPQTCGNQQVGCSRGRDRLGDDVECKSCIHDSDDCCKAEKKTCARLAVKCREGHYKLDQDSLVCGDKCVNYAEPCCTPFVKTCGNQDVVCRDDQTNELPSKKCNDCVNNGDECCVPIVATCANQNVVCRPDHYVDDLTVACGDCRNDAEPCCVPFQRTCGNQDVVCSAQQTYRLPTTKCDKCENHDDKECCVAIPKTCQNQRVACRPGHYHADYKNGLACKGCLNDDEAECCVPFVKTCGNQNVKCNKNQKPKNPSTPCDADCKNDSETCCIDVKETCGNQAVVCRPGHYVQGYRTKECGADGCLNDNAPCCSAFVPTCGNQNIKCGKMQTYRAHDTPCNGDCANEGSVCCVDVAHTCKNQNVICRPGYYRAELASIKCAEKGCTHHGDACCEEYIKTCGNQDVVCVAGQNYKGPDETCDSCKNGGGECCVDIPKTCKNQQVVCRPGHYVAKRDTLCGDKCNNDAQPCCDDFVKTCGNENVKCSKDHVPKDPQTPCDGDGCKNNSGTCCIPVTATCDNQSVVCRPGHYVADYAGKACVEKKDGKVTDRCLNDAAPCCKAYVKTCANQNVQCSAGLMKHIANSDVPCEVCANYDTKECCEDIQKTCGNSGQECRQDLYKPQDTKCTTCDVTQCCEPIPDPLPTCANQKHVCASAHYKPGAIVCEGTYRDAKCTDALCCHSFPVTCGNQNVQCHVGKYLKKDTLCTDCTHYGEECCDPQTCASKGVTCDEKYDLMKEKEFETINCRGAEGPCFLENDAAPCCKKVESPIAAPTCTNKYGITDADLKDWPFLEVLSAVVPVNCDASKGFYPRLNRDGTMVNIGCGPKVRSTDPDSNCQDNDLQCCWRKTCKSQPRNNDNKVANGFDGKGEGPTVGDFATVECPPKTKLKDNAQYIVCNGDCIDDCCDDIPDPDTCQSARVACSHGYERAAGWSTTECGDECVENSASCCQRTSCLNVKCNKEGMPATHKLLSDKLCFECADYDEECCEPIPVQDTCDNQRVHCGYGFFKVSTFNGQACDDCLDDGEECCVRKQCNGDGVDSSVSCGETFKHKGAVPCYTCVDDGAECCEPIPPAPTCQNQDVNCGFGYIHKDVNTACEDCLDNGSECCIQNTCANQEASCAGPELKAKLGSTPCTLCMDNHDECCTKQDTCWSAKVECPDEKYHKHPNTICESLPGGCSEETCCAVKTCENQGVCCNEKLGFAEVKGFDEQSCTGCADNCEECCSFIAPTCSSAKVGCGVGMHRKSGVDDVECTTCSLNDPVCCAEKTCGADAGVEGEAAYVCPEGHRFLGADVRCHWCEKDECCEPIDPPPTCRSENINCGVGMKRKGTEDAECSTCVQNDPECCVATTCASEVTCPPTHENDGGVLCVGCSVDECCSVIPTCASENVGCGFGMKPLSTDTQKCSTCALNDDACCTPTTCGTEKYACPGGFRNVADYDSKNCAFCELSECCEPIIPEKTCGNQSVGCGHGFNRIAESDDKPCGLCELNNAACCASRNCDDDQTCPSGMKRNDNVVECGFCSAEECCVVIEPPKTCSNQQVGCGFGWKEVPELNREEKVCSTCAHNDLNCCVQKTCGTDGPKCGDMLGEQDLPYTEKGAELACSDCDLAQCCVPPVIQKTCANQDVVCSAHLDAVDGATTCESCVNNGDECCVERTCVNQEVTCNSDLYTEVADHSTKTCLVCADNALECCEPKVCGHHFLDENVCDPETHTTNPRNTPCVNCNVEECCTPLPTLKCAEIEIPNGQAFYTKPAGEHSERTKGSILLVECDLGFKFQDTEYVASDNYQKRDQDLKVVDYPVCNPVLIEDRIEGHVEVFSPTTSGWNRAPPVCRPVTCPVLGVESKLTPKATEHFDIGRVLYRDAQMDEVPQRGAGYGPRDYAGEADVVCNEGWIRVPNMCAEEADEGGDGLTENTLDYELKGYWNLEGNTEDQSPHCLDSRGERKDSCNDGTLEGADSGYVEGAHGTKGLQLDGKTSYIAVNDADNRGYNKKGRGRQNELNINTKMFTVSLMAKLDRDPTDEDAYLFTRYDADYNHIVSIHLDTKWLEVKYNKKKGRSTHGDEKFPTGRWVSVIVRFDGENMQIWLDGVMKGEHRETERIDDTAEGHIFIGADKEPRTGSMNNFFDGQLDEVRYYTRAISDEEIMCLVNGKKTCSPSKYYAKPYNTQGCNRKSEEISSMEECRTAINELLQDSILGNSLNGGERFGRTITDEPKEASYDDVPSACSYREEDAQIIFNPAATGRAHTSLAPICRTNPTGKDLSTVGCLPKCLSNGKWSVELPTCEKDWCNPIFEEWSCCANREDEMDQKYYLDFHNQGQNKCPIGYGDCDDDTDCLREDGVRGYCSQRRDLDNIDVCITDLDPCEGIFGATGTLCVVMTAVGADYRAHAESGFANNMFFGGAVLVLGSLAGYYMLRSKKGEEHSPLLEEEL